MRFADPIWLLVGAASVTVVVVLLARAELLRSRALKVLVGTRHRPALSALPSSLRRWLRVGVISFAVAMGFVALARPQKGLQWETVERKGTDLLLVVDTSRSMDADDVKPTRLERAKLAIRDLVEKFPGDRIGLVAFAGDAFVQSPMTLDHAALLETVEALDSSIIARGGTNVGRAIDVAATALGTEPDHQKTMVLLTDGEDLEGQGLEEAKKAGADGIVIDTIGIGSTAGELVPHNDERGKATGVVRDEEGKPVRSRLDEASLQAVAGAAHGTYRPLGADGNGLMRLYADALAPRAHVEASSRTHRVYAELFEIPLGLALAGIVLDALLGLAWRPSARKRRPEPAPRASVARAVGAMAMVALLVFFAPRLAHASVNDAQKAYAAGHFDEAEKQYASESAKHPKDATLAFNAGDAAYKAGHLDAADAAFKRALGVADPALQQHVLYNQGNVLYRTVELAAPAATAERKEAWKSAIAAYDGALALTPKDADARFNRDFVKRKLDELEKKEEDQKKNDPPQSASNDDNNKKDGKTNRDPKDDGADKNPKDPKNAPSAGGTGASPNGKNGKDKNDQRKNGEEPDARSPEASGPNGQPPASGSLPGGQAPAGEKPDRQAPGAKLSEHEARALLGGLKGEERHAVLRTGAAGAAVEDAPRKDW